MASEVIPHRELNENFCIAAYAHFCVQSMHVSMFYAPQIHAMEVQRGLQKQNHGYARFMKMVPRLDPTTAIQPLYYAEKLLATKHQETLLWRASMDLTVLCDNLQEK